MQIADPSAGLAGERPDAGDRDRVVTAAHDRDRARSEDRRGGCGDPLVELLCAGSGERHVSAVHQAPVFAHVDSVLDRRGARVLDGRLATRLRAECGAGPLGEPLCVDGRAEESGASAGTREALRGRLDTGRAQECERIWRGPDVPHLLNLLCVLAPRTAAISCQTLVKA